MSDVIALVDDDRNILTSVSIALQQEGFVTRVYSDGASALKAFTDNMPDLGVFDIKMPGMDGMELLRRLRESSSIPVIFLTSKDDEVDEALGLAMGADDAILVADPALTEGLDTVGAARVLAAAIQKIGGVDMAVFGRQTLDNGAGLTPAQTARVLGWPMLGLAGQIRVQDGSVTVDRVIEEGRQTVKAKLPAVVSVVQSIGEPRYPSFMGIRKASKATIPVWSLSDLGVSAPAAIVKRTELLNPPVRETAVEIITGESPAEIADKLADKILAEKVL